MKKNLCLLLATFALAALSAAFAQTNPVAVGVGSFDVDNPARVAQTIILSIPQRMGLHLHRSSWILNLNDISDISSADAPRCYRAGEHNRTTGRDERYRALALLPANRTFLNLFNNTLFSGDSNADDSSNAYDFPASLVWIDAGGPGGSNRIQRVSSYPGFEVSNGRLLWKGPIMCVFQTVIQKYANTLGYRMTAELTDISTPLPGAPFPDLVLRERKLINNITTAPYPQQQESAAFTLNSANLGPRTLSINQNRTVLGFPLAATTTRGWYDAQLLEALVFDGTEMAGSYSAKLVFKLTDLTTP